MHRAWKNLIFLRYPISRRSWQERRQSTVAYTGVEQRRRLRRGAQVPQKLWQNLWQNLPRITPSSKGRPTRLNPQRLSASGPLPSAGEPKPSCLPIASQECPRMDEVRHRPVTLSPERLTGDIKNNFQIEKLHKNSHTGC